MAEPWTLLIAAHAAGATLALLLGGYLVVRRRKGDLLHRRVGRVWMATMYWVSFSSFGIQRLDPGHFTWIHGLSLWTIVSLSVAIWAAATHRIAQHRLWVVGTYLGLVGAGIAAVAFPQRLVPQTAVHHPGLLLAALLGVTVFAVAVVALAARAPSVAEVGVTHLGDRVGSGRDLQREESGSDAVAHRLLREEEPPGARRVVTPAAP